MMKPSNLLRLVAVGAAAAAFAACTPRPAADSPAGNDIPSADANPQYPGAGAGAVDGGALGSATGSTSTSTATRSVPRPIRASTPRRRGCSAIRT